MRLFKALLVASGFLLLGPISLGSVFFPQLTTNVKAADSRFMYYTCNSISEMAQTGWSSQNLNNSNLSLRPLDSFWEVQGPSQIKTISYWINRGVLWETTLDNNYNLWIRESTNQDFTGLPQTWRSGTGTNIYQNWQNMGLQNSPSSSEPIKAMVGRKNNNRYEQLVFVDPPLGSPAGASGKVYVIRAQGPDSWQLENYWRSYSLNDVWAGQVNRPPNRITAYSYRLREDGNIEEIAIANNPAAGGTPYVWWRRGTSDDAASAAQATWQSKPLSESWATSANAPAVDQINSFNTVPYKGALRQIVTTPTKAYFMDCFSYPQSVTQKMVNAIDVYSRYYIDRTDYSQPFTVNYSSNNYAVNDSGHARAGMFRSITANAVALAGRFFADGNPADKNKSLEFLNTSIDRYGNPDSQGKMGWEQAWLSSITVWDTARLAWIFWNDLTPTRRAKVQQMVEGETQYLVDHFKRAEEHYRSLMNENGGNFTKVTALTNAFERLPRNPSQPRSQPYIVDPAFSDAPFNFTDTQIRNSHWAHIAYFAISNYINDTKAEENDASAQMLALAANMFPTHSKAAEWDRYAKCYAFHTNTTGNEAEYCGIRTKNIYNDYTVSNHDMRNNPVYTMAAISGLTYGEFTYVMAGKTPPSEFRHNRYNVWNNFFNYFYYTDNKQDPNYRRNFEIKEQFLGDWQDKTVKLVMNSIAYEAVFGADNERARFKDWEVKMSGFLNNYYYHKMRMHGTVYDNLVFPLNSVTWCFPESASQCNNAQNNYGRNDQIGQWFQNSLADGRGAADVILYHKFKDGTLRVTPITTLGITPAAVTFNSQSLPLSGAELSTRLSPPVGSPNEIIIPVSVQDSVNRTTPYTVRFIYRPPATPTPIPTNTPVPTLTPTPAPSGTISASPNPCIIPWGSSQCTSTISWSTVNASNVSVKVGSSTFSSGVASGSQIANWISSAGATFDLYSGGTKLASIIARGNLAPSATPTPTNTPTPTRTPTPTPTPTPCPAITEPTGVMPVGSVSPGSKVFSWNAVSGASKYAIGIDDSSNPYTGNCSSPNAGDACSNNVTGTTFTHTLQPGKTYWWWVNAINSCGSWSSGTVKTITVPAPTPTPTATPTPTLTPTNTPIPTATPTSRPTNTPIPTSTPIPTNTPEPSVSSAAFNGQSLDLSGKTTLSARLTNGTGTTYNIPVNVGYSSGSPRNLVMRFVYRAVSTPTPSAGPGSPTPTSTVAPTSTPVPTRTPTPTPTSMPTPTGTPTSAPTSIPTPTATPTPSAGSGSPTGIPVPVVSAVTVNNQNLDLTGANVSSLTLSGQGSTYDLPINVNYSSGTPRNLVVRFIKTDTPTPTLSAAQTVTLNVIDDGFAINNWGNNEANPNVRIGQQYDAGFRFSLPIPARAQITSAFITAFANYTSSPTTVDIKAENTLNSAPLSSLEQGTFVPNRTYFNGNISWSMSGYNRRVTSPDIKTLVQNVVDQPGWQAKNNILIALLDGNTDYGDLVSRESDLAKAVQLTVTYTVTGSLTPTPTPDVPVTQTLNLTVADDGFDINGWGHNNTNPGVRAGRSYNAGFRFALPIPKGAHIVSAKFSPYIEFAEYPGAVLNIKAENSTGSLPLSGDNPFISNRPYFGSSVSWNTGNDNYNKYIESPDIKNLIQEVVGQGNWVSGGNIMLALMRTDDKYTQFTSKEGDSAKAAKLAVEYQITTPTPTGISTPTPVPTIVPTNTPVPSVSAVTLNGQNLDLTGVNISSLTLSGEGEIFNLPLTVTYSSGASRNLVLRVVRQIRPTPTPVQGGELRDPLKWPYTQNSIWNMPVGSGAVYVPANLSSDPGGLIARGIARGENRIWVGIGRIDTETMVFEPNAPLVDVYQMLKPWDKPGNPNDRCLIDNSKPIATQVRIPSSYVYPSDDQNAVGVFLKGDGRTIQQMAPIARCQAGGPVTVDWYPAFDSDIYNGDGLRGARGGSGMSAFGGSIRIGELRPGQVGMRHALKLTVYDREALYDCSKSAWGDYTSDCFRWPAITSDAGAIHNYGAAGNRNPAMKMGALLAIPATVNLANLGLQTEPARQLAWTLQNYGAYIVDTTPGEEIYLAAESGFPGQPSLATQFKNDWGYDFEQHWWDKNSPSPWISDIRKLIDALYVVDNNSPSSIGGGGTSRQPLAPLFGSQTPTPTPASPVPTAAINVSCIPSPNTGNEVTITWPSSSPAISYLDIDNDNNWGNGFYNKQVSGTSTQAPADFEVFEGLGPLVLVPNNTYYVRSWNGVANSSASTFTTPAACIIPTSTPVPTTIPTPTSVPQTTNTPTPSVSSISFNGQNLDLTGTNISSLTLSGQGNTYDLPLNVVYSSGTPRSLVVRVVRQADTPTPTPSSAGTLVPGVYIFEDWENEDPGIYPFVKGGGYDFGWDYVESNGGFGPKDLSRPAQKGSVEEFVRKLAGKNKRVYLMVGFHSGEKEGRAEWGAKIGDLTPDWVYTNYGVPKIEAGGYRFPKYTDGIDSNGNIVGPTRYLNAVENMVKRFAEVHDGDPRIEMILAGGGVYGESYPYHLGIDGIIGDAFMDAGVTPAAWETYINKILSMYKKHFTKTPLFFNPGHHPRGNQGHKRAMIDDAIKQGFNIGWHGLDGNPDVPFFRLANWDGYYGWYSATKDYCEDALGLPERRKCYFESGKNDQFKNPDPYFVAKYAYWEALMAMDKHGDYLGAYSMQSRAPGMLQIYQMFNDYAGRTINTTPGVWIAFKKETPGFWQPQKDGTYTVTSNTPSGSKTRSITIYSNYGEWLTQFNPDGTTEGLFDIGGKEGLFARRTKSGQSFLLQIDDSYISPSGRFNTSSSGKEAKIKVAYLDNSGSFEVFYDSKNSTKKSAGVVSKGTTNSWKVWETTVSDAYFGGRITGNTADKTDLEIKPSGGELTLHMVEIRAISGSPAATPTNTPAPTNTPVVSSVVLSGQNLDLTGANISAVTLSGQGSTYDLPINVNYSSGTPRNLVVRFVYQNSVTPTAVPTFTPVPTSIPTNTPTPSAVPTATPVPTLTPTVIPTDTPTPTSTPTPTTLPTNTPTPTQTPTATPTQVPTHTPAPTNTPVPTNTPIPTVSSISFNNQNLDLTGANVSSLTLSGQGGTYDLPINVSYSSGAPRNLVMRFIYQGVPTPTIEPTGVPVPTNTPTPTQTPTATPIPTLIPTSTPTPVPTSTPTEVPTNTPTPIEMPTDTPTPTAVPSDAPTPTPAPSVSSVALNGQNIDLTGGVVSSLTLSGGEGGIYDLPIAVNYSSGAPRSMIVRFVYQAGITPTPTAVPTLIPSETPVPTATPVPILTPTQTPEPALTITPTPTDRPTATPTPETRGEAEITLVPTPTTAPTGGSALTATPTPVSRERSSDNTSPARTVRPAVTAVNFGGQFLDPSGQSPLSLRLPGERNQQASFTVPITVSQTSGSPRGLTLRIVYRTGGGTTGGGVTSGEETASKQYDFNDDMVINSFDVGLFFNEWRKKLNGEETVRGDLNADEFINSVDYSLLKSRIGKRVQ